MAKNFYAYYFDSTNQGITASWNECASLVKGSSARYKGFKTELEAKKWLDSGAVYEVKEKSQTKPREITILEEGIYFDAGTGRGNGVEVKVTDKKGVSLLHNHLERKGITYFDTFLIPNKQATNNFGELLGVYFALEISKKLNIKKIFGDSKLVIDYWSKGVIKDTVAEETKELAKMVTSLRKEFELNGGTIERVSGDINPADLGFHK